MAAYQESCAFAGHRPTALPWTNYDNDPRCESLRRRLADALRRAYADGFRHFLCGMAQGCDLLFCEAVLDLRRERPDITIEAALPYPQQASRWTLAQRMRHYELLQACDVQTPVSPCYTRSCMLKRDRYMVDRAALLLAVYDGVPGGTRYTIEYALRRGVEVRYIPPLAPPPEESNDPPYQVPF